MAIKLFNNHSDDVDKLKVNSNSGLVKGGLFAHPEDNHHTYGISIKLSEVNDALERVEQKIAELQEITHLKNI
jgi:hypothetical protein